MFVRERAIARRSVRILLLNICIQREKTREKKERERERERE